MGRGLSDYWDVTSLQFIINLHSIYFVCNHANKTNNSNKNNNIFITMKQHWRIYSDEIVGFWKLLCHYCIIRLCYLDIHWRYFVIIVYYSIISLFNGYRSKLVDAVSEVPHGCVLGHCCWSCSPWTVFLHWTSNFVVKLHCFNLSYTLVKLLNNYEQQSRKWSASWITN